MTSLHIRDPEIAAALARVAKRLGTSEMDVVRAAIRRVEAELDAGTSAQPRQPKAREIIERYWREHPLPPPTGLKADKAFFDELSGDT